VAPADAQPRGVLALDRDGAEGAAMKQIRKIQMRSVAEDGSETHTPQAIYTEVGEGTTLFVIKVPEYVSAALGGDNVVRDERQTQVVLKFEKRMRDYREHVLNARAEPVIILETKLIARDRRDADDDTTDRQRIHDVERKAFFLEHDVGDRHSQRKLCLVVSYALGYRVSGRIYDRREVDKHDHFDGKPPTFKPGALRQMDDSEVVLDFTPELHAKIDRICDALHSAALTLHEICAAKDVAGALLAHTGLVRLPAPEPAIAKAKRGKR
jgi:hypothetical protein